MVRLSGHEASSSAAADHTELTNSRLGVSHARLHCTPHHDGLTHTDYIQSKGSITTVSTRRGGGMSKSDRLPFWEIGESEGCGFESRPHVFES